MEEEKENISSSFASTNAEREKLNESSTLMHDELQKSYMTISAYEEQILRLNQQLSLESLEKQKREEFLEKKVRDLTSKVDSMEEGMYDPEAYYCLERDRCLEEANRLEDELQAMTLTSEKKELLPWCTEMNAETSTTGRLCANARRRISPSTRKRPTTTSCSCWNGKALENTNRSMAYVFRLAPRSCSTEAT